MAHNDDDLLSEAAEAIEAASDQRSADSSALVVRQNCHWGQGYRVEPFTRHVNPHPAEEDMSHDLFIQFRNERQQHEPLLP
jgi:hypothetical protein